MAREDLTKTTREESASIMKRISSTASGPRQRLAAPVSSSTPASGSVVVVPSLASNANSTVVPLAGIELGPPTDPRHLISRPAIATGTAGHPGPRPRRDWTPRTSSRE